MVLAINKKIDEKIAGYIINLDHSVERYLYTAQCVRNVDIPFERVSAISGIALSNAKIKDVTDIQLYLRNFGYYPDCGTIGCFLSHIKAWETFLASKNEYALIFEDDINFDAEEMRNMVGDLLKVPKMWDVVNFAFQHHGHPLTIHNFNDNINAKKRLVVFTTETACAAAYIINRHAATQLLKHAFPITMPIDKYFSYAWNLKFKFCGIEPRLQHKFYGDSDIKKCREQICFVDDGSITKTSYVLQKSCKPFYKLHSYIVRFMYNIGVCLGYKYKRYNKKKRGNGKNN
jgi:glycosyl transferase, family 25